MPSLSLPEPQRAVDGQGLLDSEAVQLFVDRARSRLSDLTFDADELAVVAQICRQLDALPLAIELAAAMVRIMPVGDILARLQHRFALLTLGTRTAPARQRSLLATVEWSYGLLTDEERSLFSRLGVFVGGFDLEAVEEIGRDADHRGQVTQLLFRLVDKSLVVANQRRSRPVRFRLLDTLRQFALERLSESEGIADVRQRHGWHFQRIAATAARLWAGGEQVRAVELIQDDHDNLLAALEWGLANHPEMALEISNWLADYWMLRADFGRGGGRLEAAVRAFPGTTLQHGMATGAIGRLALLQGDRDRGRDYLQRALAILSELGASTALLRILNNLAADAGMRGNADAAYVCLVGALEMAEELDDDQGRSQTLNNLACVQLMRRDWDGAQGLAQRALDAGRRCRNGLMMLFALTTLAGVRLAGLIAGAVALGALVPANAVASRGSDGSGAYVPFVLAPHLSPGAAPASATGRIPNSKPRPEQAQPATATAASPAASADVYGGTNSAHRLADGSLTVKVGTQPASHNTQQGPSPIDVKLAPESGGAGGVVAGGGFKPVHFGTSPAKLVVVDLGGGPLTLSGPALTIAAPTVMGRTVTYSSVAPSTDLSYTVAAASIKEELVLRSAGAPHSFSFHLADPASQLGSRRSLPSGAQLFEPGHQGEPSVQLAEPYAYQSTGGPAKLDPGSAHLATVPAGDGYDLTISVDEAWLAGKAYPIVLDPTIVLQPPDTLSAGWTYNSPSTCGGCTALTTSGPFGAGNWEGDGVDWQPIRSFFRADLSAIPPGSTINTARLTLSVAGCVSTVWVCSRGPYTLDIQALTGAWSGSSTYDDLLAITGTTPAATITQPPFAAGLPFPEQWDLHDLVSHWYDGSVPNFGFVARVRGDESPPGHNIGGPAWCDGVIACDPQFAPALEINFTPPRPQLQSSVLPSRPSYPRGLLVTYSTVVTNPTSQPMPVDQMLDVLPAGMAPQGTAITLDGQACDAGTAPACSLSGGTVTVGVFTLDPLQSRTFRYQAVVVGSDRGCSSVANSASAAGEGGISTASAPLLACATGLGDEKWNSYLHQTPGPQADAAVDMANGNLWLSQLDTTAIQAHGKLSYALVRSFNSQDDPTVAMPSMLGAGWNWSMSAVSDDTGGAGDVTPSALYVPAGESAANPFAVTVVDASGDRQVLVPRDQPATAFEVGLGVPGPRAILEPRALTLGPQYNHLCVDRIFAAPPGFHLSLWRYLEVASHGMSNPCSHPDSGTTPAVLGFVAERPDRARYEFAWDGHLLDVVDAAGTEFAYTYDHAPAAGADLGRITFVYEAKVMRQPQPGQLPQVRIPVSAGRERGPGL